MTFGELRLGGGEVRLSLYDLVRALPLLQAQRRFALCDLRAGAFRAEGIKGALLAQFVRRQHRDQLPGFHRLALLGHQLRDAAGDLRADHDVIGGHHASERQRRRWPAGVPPAPVRDADDDNEWDQTQQAFHGIKTIVSNTCLTVQA
jgi:hypothetical protein